MPSAPLETECDVLVIGSGAAGLAAAVTAAWHGQKVIVAEKEPVFGGATAWSGGWAWVPRNPLARRAGIEEDIEQPRTYLRHELGANYNAERVDAFLEACPHMVAFFEKYTALQFADGNGIPDMHGDTPGAALGGHQVIAAPYDAREVGALLPRLRKTMRETSFMGMPIMAGADLAAFLNMTRSPKALLHVCKRFGRHLYHLARHGRAMHLVNGVALVARLAKSAQDLGVHLQASAPAKRLLIEGGQVRGAWVATPQGEQLIRAKAVVLAAGGFPNDNARRQQLFPRDASGHDNLALPPKGCSGDGLRLGESSRRRGCHRPEVASGLGTGFTGAVSRRQRRPLPAHYRARQTGRYRRAGQRQAFRQRSAWLLRLCVGHGRCSAAGPGGVLVAGLRSSLLAPLWPGACPPGTAAGRAACAQRLPETRRYARAARPGLRH